MPLSTTLDHVGPMARTVADAALAITRCSTATRDSIGWRRRRRVALLARRARPVLSDKLDPDVRRLFGDARDAARAARATASRRRDPARGAHRRRLPAHRACRKRRGITRRCSTRYADRYSPGVRLRLEMGRYVLAEDYVRAMHARARLRARRRSGARGLDALLLPALPIAAPPIGAAIVTIGGRAEPVRAMMLRLTQLFNITGHPAIALPVRPRRGRPAARSAAGRPSRRHRAAARRRRGGRARPGRG